MADAAYDSDKFREQISAQGAIACIKPRCNRKVDIPFDKEQYKERHLVECFFQAIACIKPRCNRKVDIPFDKEQYKERHLVECFFQKLKRYRRIATRYDKLAVRFLAFIHVACILIWLL